MSDAPENNDPQEKRKPRFWERKFWEPKRSLKTIEEEYEGGAKRFTLHTEKTYPLFAGIAKRAAWIICVLLWFVGVIAIEVVWALLKWPLRSLLGRAWSSFFSGVGTNQLGFFLGLTATVLTAVITALFVLWLFGREAMKKHLKEAAFIAIAAAILVTPITYAPFFVSKIAQTIHEDQQSLKIREKENEQLQAQIASNCKDDKQKAQDPVSENGKRGTMHGVGRMITKGFRTER